MGLFWSEDPLDDRVAKEAEKSAQREQKRQRPGFFGRLLGRGDSEFDRNLRYLSKQQRGKVMVAHKKQEKDYWDNEFPRLKRRKERDLRRQSLSFPEGSREIWFNRKMNEFTKEYVTWRNRDVKHALKRQLEDVAPDMRNQAYKMKEQYGEQLRAQKERQMLGKEQSTGSAGKGPYDKKRFGAFLPPEFPGKSSRRPTSSDRSSYTNPGR